MKASAAVAVFGAVLFGLCVWGTAFAADGCGERRTVSLDGLWSVSYSGHTSDQIPPVFGSKIPVPGHWPLIQPPFPCPKRGALWCRTSYRAPKELPPRVVLRIGKAQFGRTVFINGKKAGFYPYNFNSSETDIRPFLRAGETNDVVVRVKMMPSALQDKPVAHVGVDAERHNYFPGIYDSVSVIESGWPAIVHLDVASDLERGVAQVRVKLVNGAKETMPSDLELSVGAASVRVPGAALGAGETRTVVGEVKIPGFDRRRDAWTPENPRLYEIAVRSAGDAVRRRFGMRTFDTDRVNQCFRLNGERRMLLGTNTDLFRFLDDPDCGTKPWDRAWVRKLFAEFKRVGWDSFRNCISAVPDFWYDLCDEMGLMIQDEYPYWGCGRKCKCTGETMYPDYVDWLADRGTHPSIVIIDLQNERRPEAWFVELLARLRPLDWQRRPFDNGFAPANPDPDSPREFHPYLFVDSEFSLGCLNHHDGHLTYSIDGPLTDPEPHPAIINEYGWNWINRRGEPTRLSQSSYAFNCPKADNAARRAFYAWSVGALTEYWRATGKLAALMHFTSLTYSFERGDTAFTGDILCPDITEPRIRPEVFARFRSAFAPVTVVVEDYLEDVPAGVTKAVPVSLLNEDRSGGTVTREVTVRLTAASGATSFVQRVTLTAPPHGKATASIRVPVPTEPGDYVLRAGFSDEIVSERRWRIGGHPGGWAFGKAATASSEYATLFTRRSAAAATDGSLRTSWLSAYNDGHTPFLLTKKSETAPFLRVDLGERRALGRCRIAWFVRGDKVLSPQRVRISVSEDGKAFRPVQEVAGTRTASPEPDPAHPEHATWQDIALPADTAARHIRIEACGGLPGGAMGIGEVVALP